MGAWYGPPPIVWWSMPEPIPNPAVGTQVIPSSSVYEVLHVGEVKVSCAAKVRPVTRSTKPMGSWSTPCEVGAGRFTHVAFGLVGLQVSLNVTKSVCRSDWKAVTPFTLLGAGEFQFTPIEGSPASCAMYSTVLMGCPWLLVTTVVKTPGPSKFSNPSFGPGSTGAGAAAIIVAWLAFGLTRWGADREPVGKSANTARTMLMIRKSAPRVARAVIEEELFFTDGCGFCLE